MLCKLYNLHSTVASATQQKGATPMSKITNAAARVKSFAIEVKDFAVANPGLALISCALDIALIVALASVFGLFD